MDPLTTPAVRGRATRDATILAAILLLAALFRFNGIDWDSGSHQHPDERFLTDVAGRLQLPSSLGEYFNTPRSPLNPYARGFAQYAYGQLPMTLTRAAGEAVGMVRYENIHFVGRALSALADLGTLVFAWLLARRLFGTGTAHLSALFLALAVLPIQLAHFFAVDTYAQFFCAGALYFAQRARERESLVDTAWSGALAGLAAASKVSALVLLPVLLVAFLWPRTRRPWRDLLLDGATAFGVAVLAAVAAVRLAEPYAFAGPNVWNLRPNLQWFSDKAYWASVSSGGVDVPYMIQWAGTSPYLFSVQGLVQWGLGPALGVASLAGFVLAGWQLVRGNPAAPQSLLLFLWVGINLAYFGGQFAKFLRYLVPIYFALCILAAWLLVTFVRASRNTGQPNALRWVAAAVTSLVVLATAGWALAFSAIYAQPHSRLQASEWIYANVPPGKVLAVEHWDDRLPLSLPEPRREGSIYRYADLPLYDPENPAKRDKLLLALDQADYIVLASRRLADSIPRLPERYPLATAYYQWLFAGRLGFEQVAVFQVGPRIGPLGIDDSAAQEDFTVYDHPVVEIWAKRADYSASTTRELFSSIPLDRVLNVKPVDAGKRGLLLSPEERIRAEQGGTWSSLFDRGGLANRFPVAAWLLAAEMMAFSLLPLLWRALRWLPDGGFGASKILGLAVITYPAWLLASLKTLPFGRLSLLLVWAALATLSGVVAWRNRRELTRWLRGNWWLLVAIEAAFLAGTALFLAIRSINPDLWHPSFGGEKPMNFAYLNAIIKSDYFPPYDPWFAGGYVNYYYYSFVLVAALVKLTGVEPGVAFNLAQPSFYGAICAGVFSLAYAVALPRPWRLARKVTGIVAGSAAVLLVAVLGNLDAGLQVLDQVGRLGAQRVPESAGVARFAAGLQALAAGQGLPPLDFWRSTRFIGPEESGPIHEFPYFTFLYGDLHAHQLALPLAVAALLVALSLARSARHRPYRLDWAAVGLAALLVGMLRAANTWDFPTYAAITAAALMLGYLPGLASGDRRAWLAFGGSVGALLALSQLLFWPYLARYQLFYTGVEPIPWRTALGQYLTIHGLFAFLLASLLAWRVSRLNASAAQVRAVAQPLPVEAGYYGIVLPFAAHLPRVLAGVPGGVAISGAILGGAFWLAGYPTRGFILACLGAAGAVGLATWRYQPSTAFLSGLVAVALGVTLVPEFVALQGDVGRMNTVFKFYFQAWLLLGVASAVALGLLWTWAARDRRAREWRGPWGVIAIILVLSAAAYPLLASETKLSLRFAQIGRGLDGMTYMDHATYVDRERDLNLPADAMAIRWLQDNVQGSPPILEGRAPLYRWGSRVSVYTGLPTILGWDWHQTQQRFGYAAMIQERAADVQRAYDSPTPADLLGVARKYGVSWVYVGGLERAYYSPAGLEKLSRMPELRLAYDRDGVQIYQVAG